MNPVRSHRPGNRLKQVLTEPAHGPVEIVSALYMFAYSVPLFSADVVERYPTYAQMSKIAPGWAWGSSLCLLAALRIVTVLKPWHRGRILTTGLSIFGWSLLFLNFFLAQKWHPGLIAFGVWAGMETWTLFRIQR